MATKLGIYNKALATYIGTRRLATLTDDDPARYALDAVYDEAVAYVLERGSWMFALRTVQLTKEVTAPTFHRQHAYTKPSDFVRIARIASDARFSQELLGYRDERGTIYSDIDPIFLQYVSNGALYGMDLTKWPPTFVEAVASWLAYQSTLEVSKDRGDRADLLKLSSAALDTARRLDAVDEPVKGKPAGRFTRSRSWGTSMSGTLRGLRY